MSYLKLYKITQLFFLILPVTEAIFSQPTLPEIKKHRIKSVTEISRVDSTDYSKKTVYNIYGHDSLIYYNGELTFYSKTEVDASGRLKQFIFYNKRNDNLEEVHQFKYNSNGSYSIEVIAQGAGLIETSTYNSANQLIKSIDSDEVEITYLYNREGKVEKIFQKIGKGKKQLVSSTTFNEKNTEIKTEVYGKEPALVYYEHDTNGLITKIRLIPKSSSGGAKEIIYKYEFLEN